MIPSLTRAIYSGVRMSDGVKLLFSWRAFVIIERTSPSMKRAGSVKLIMHPSRTIIVIMVVLRVRSS